MKSEFAFIQSLQKRIRLNRSGEVGIGDDGAVLKCSKNARLVLANDAIVEDVDFRFQQAKAEWIGRKALAINLSDLAAMGATPKYFTIALGLPKKISNRWLETFYFGLLKLAKKYKITCVGGDLSASKTFFASVAVTGEIPNRQSMPLRSRAKAGDWIAVTGVFGGSLAGHHFEFEPRVKEGQFLARNGLVHAMIDVSDGLTQDLGHILKASKKGASLQLDQIPISKAAMKSSKGSLRRAQMKALGDGEDFELLFTASSKSKKVLEKKWKRSFPKTRLSWIGRVKSTSGIQWLDQDQKVRWPQKLKKGYQHF